MKTHLLDAGPLTAYLAGRPNAVSVIEPLIGDEVATTSVLVYGEIIEHLLGRPRYEARKHELHVVMQQLEPRTLNPAVLERYATLRRQMRRPYGSGTIGDIDTLLAATALEHDLTVVTSDRDFSRVPGLRTILMLPQHLKRP